MTALAAGNNVEVYIPLEGSMTITPGSGGHVEFGCSSPSAEAPAGRDVYAAAAITIPAGSTVFLRAVGADATYAAPEVSASAVNTAYTAAQLAAMESAGTLTLNAWYVASDSGAWGLATAVNVIAWIDFDALALAMAEGLATDDSDTISRKSGIPPSMTELVALAEATCYPRPITLYLAGGLGVFTQPAATWTSVTASNNGSGKLRLSSAGIHGLATVGRKIYVGFATTGSGLHEIATIVNTTDLDFTTDFADVSGAVTVYVANAPSKCLDTVCTIPGNVIGPNGRVVASFIGKCSTAATKYLYWYLDGSLASEGSWSAGSETIMFGETIICNAGSTSSQVITPFRYNAANPDYPLTKDTTQALVLSLRLRVPTADNYINLDSLSVTVTPGV